MARDEADATGWVNDIHSGLNPTPVRDVIAVRSQRDIEAAIARAHRLRLPLAIAGGRHAMSGQQFARNALLLDMRGLDQVRSFDRVNGLIEVEAGIQWPTLFAWLQRIQQRDARAWAVAQKQTGADGFTLGGSLAANIHGRGLAMRPIIADVESFTLLDANGDGLHCSRTDHPQLFRLAIGGYGLFGVIASVTLRLAPRRKLRRVVEITDIGDVTASLEQRVAEGYLYGDFQFAIDERKSTFLRRGVLSCYHPVADDTPMPAQQLALSERDWSELVRLAHTDKQAAFDRYSQFYLATSGQLYHSDTHQLSVYLNGYHGALDERLGHTGSEVITELYVPREQLVDFMTAAAEGFRRHAVDLIYGTVRLIRRDDESFLAWARQDYACVVFNLHIRHSAAGATQSAVAFRHLIDLVIGYGGSFYLTYHRHATARQLETCYPQFREFLAWKLAYDPQERFQSDWYRHYRRLFVTLD
ncbi:FAD-binding oxidoreductase [Pseudogulbenkiania sp. MAI-1]|uniref:FAD-binding oxidoreductase n=1 Tax=Pseudogulbenkiania sp. MAI-1 TaxID=990370 RepID=UPI0018DE485D|nr:FAD-binding oxidoreductase [Pseudogulbenkiania sp. MAI-1]